MVEAYPLQWPVGWKRTKWTTTSQFGDHTIFHTTNNLCGELRKLGATNIVISTDLELKLDGLPRSGRRQPEDQGVAVYFKLNGESQCMPCDKWDKIEHNVWAIFKSVSALRGLDRWGAKEMVDAAFRGFKALPAPEGLIVTDSVSHDHDSYFNTCYNGDDLKIVYKQLVKKHHPDLGGDAEIFKEINRQHKLRSKELDTFFDSESQG